MMRGARLVRRNISKKISTDLVHENNLQISKNKPVQYLVADATRQMRRPRQVAKKAKKAANQRTTWLNPNDQSTPSRITLKIASPDARVFNENRRKDSPSEKNCVLYWKKLLFSSSFGHYDIPYDLLGPRPSLKRK